MDSNNNDENDDLNQQIENLQSQSEQKEIENEKTDVNENEIKESENDNIKEELKSKTTVISNDDDLNEKSLDSEKDLEKNENVNEIASDKSIQQKTNTFEKNTETETTPSFQIDRQSNQKTETQTTTSSQSNNSSENNSKTTFETNDLNDSKQTNSNEDAGKILTSNNSTNKKNPIGDGNNEQMAAGEKITENSSDEKEKKEIDNSKLPPELHDHSKDRKRTWKEFFTDKKTWQGFEYGYGYFAIGLTYSILGPTLLALAANTNSTVSEMSIVSGARSIGYILGAFGGPIADKINGHWLISTCYFLCVITLLATPFVTNMWFLAFITIIPGLVLGLNDTVVNVYILRLFEGDPHLASPFLQFQHFSFGVASFLMPLFLTAVDGLLIPYILSACFMLPHAILCFYFKPPPTKSENFGHLKRNWADAVVVTAFAFIFFCYIGMENGTYVDLYTYATDWKGFLNDSGGNIVSSLFWIGITVGRAILVFASVKIRPVVLMWIEIVGGATVLIIWAIFQDSVILFWILIPVFGMFMGPIYPTAVTVVESFVSLTGTVALWFVIFGGLGDFVGPVATLNLVEHFDEPVLFAITILVLMIIGFVSYLVATVSVKYTSKRQITLEEMAVIQENAFKRSNTASMTNVKKEKV